MSASTTNVFLKMIPLSLFHRAILAGSLAVFLTALFELTCLDQVTKMRSTVQGRALYASSLRANLLNNLVLGPITYYLSVRYVCRSPNETMTLQEQIVAACGMVLIEGISYYLIHKAFHEVKGLYWMHKYHHSFNEIVLPSSANAVSVWEYTIAYMLPLAWGAALAGADEVAAFSGLAVIAVSNLLIHTPWLEQYEYPGSCWIFCSTSDHLSHHGKTLGNYGAPVFHMDRIMERCLSSLEGKGSKMQ